MNHRVESCLGLVASALALALVVAPVPGYAETQGPERRDDRGEARDTRQTGRDAAQDAKEKCKDGDDSRAECRQMKHGMKQDSREGARDVKQND